MQLRIIDLNFSPYEETWKLQKELQEKRFKDEIPDTLILVEHPHTYTVGASGGDGDFLLLKNDLEKKGIGIFKIERGGKTTYHGPGQLVGYPIINLKPLKLGPASYVRLLEEAIIKTVVHFGIPAFRLEKLTGVWAGNEKVAAIGVRIKKWVTMHGFALNVNTDLNYFSNIIPCGIQGKGVTSMEKILYKKASMEEVKKAFILYFKEIFNYRDLS